MTAANVDSNKTGHEFLFMAMQAFPDAMEVLLDPNIWTCNSGASADATGNKLGLIDLQTAEEGEGAWCANGGVAKSESIGRLPATL